MRTILSIVFVFCALSVSAMRFVSSTDHNEMRVFLCWIILEEFGEDALIQDFAKNPKQRAVIKITYHFEKNQISVEFLAADGFFADENRQRQFIEAISSVDAIFFYEPFRYAHLVPPAKEIKANYVIFTKPDWVKLKENDSKVLVKLKENSSD